MQIRESFILPWMVLVIGVFFIVQLQVRVNIIVLIQRTMYFRRPMCKIYNFKCY